MLLEKSIVNVLERDAYLILIDLLWRKATCFSLSNADPQSEIAVKDSVLFTRGEKNMRFFPKKSKNFQKGASKRLTEGRTIW